MVTSNERVQFKKVLVTVGGTSVDDEALKLACKLIKGEKGKVYVTYVIQVDRTLPLEAEVEAEIKRGEEVLNQAEMLIEDQDCEAETDLLQARDVGAAVVDEAVERGIDLIMVGRSYKKEFGEFSLGKIVPYVLKNAPCWVMIFQEPMPKDER
ncbi:universal stress protein [Chloroflexota bacterium]